METSRPGIFVCGVMQGPKDIPGSVTEASAAACVAGANLTEARGLDVPTIAVPAERDVTGQDPRIGVFVCNCGINIGGIVDVPGVRAYAESLPYVAFADENLFTCSQDTQEKIKEKIKEHKLNRVVVASCSPKTHEPMFMETLEACGLNKYLFEMANIRNQDSWIHSKDPQAATEKAKDLVRMSVARAAHLRTLHEKVVPINKRALVIGGGVAGMNAALGLGNQGFEVSLLEKEPELGGYARKLHHTIEGADIKAYLGQLVSEVEAHDKIEVITDARIVGFEGFKGSFKTAVQTGSESDARKIDHGIIIVATGANEYQPKEYLYGQEEGVVTQVELSDRLAEKGAADLNSVVMIQCVGSRNEENENCSRICCQSAVKNALEIKKLNPDAQVYVLYRDMRTYGLLEDFYKEARQQGVIFIRFDRNTPPVVGKNGDGLAVTVKDHVLQQNLEIGADLVTLSAGSDGHRHLRAEQHHETQPQPGGLFHRGPRQIAAGGHAQRRHLFVWDGSWTQADHGNHRPGPGRGRTGHDLSGPGSDQTVGHHRQGGRRALRQVPDLCALLPLRGAGVQYRKERDRNQRGALPRLRRVHGRLPASDDCTELL